MNQIRHVTMKQVKAILTLTDMQDARRKERRLRTGGGLVKASYFADEIIELYRNGEPIRDALFEFLMLLPEPALREVAGLMWLGRGDFSTLQEGAEYFFTSHGLDAAVDYIVGKSPLGQYLRAGIELLDKRAAAA